MKFRYPKGILGGILKYGINPTAILHAWLAVFIQRDQQRMREKRLKREAEARKNAPEGEMPHVEETNPVQNEDTPKQKDGD